MSGDQANSTDQPEAEQQVTRVIWDDSELTTTFANVINVLNTREEFTLLFGLNQTWNPGGTHELSVKLKQRIVLTPFAAKRLLTLLHQQIASYEERFGSMRIDAQG